MRKFFCGSKGSINKIDIKNSYFDGLDIDFSSISIENVIIEKSNNDCIDLSSGNYDIEKIKINSCGDKGISIGEKASFYSNDVKITSTNFGVASKDSSISKFNNLLIENSHTCLCAYRKKQEFSGGVLEVNNLNCKNYIYKNEFDKKSKIKVHNEII